VNLNSGAVNIDAFVTVISDIHRLVERRQSAERPVSRIIPARARGVDPIIVDLTVRLDPDPKP
jgi:hypothetical protein